MDLVVPIPLGVFMPLLMPLAEDIAEWGPDDLAIKPDATDAIRLI